MEFRLLGALEARRDAEVLALGPPKRRALLLRLLLDNGHTVGVERLCDDLWNGRPPPSAVSSVHAHISRLRAVLEPGRGREERPALLRSVPTGYALCVPPDLLDSARFERSVRQAHALAADGRVGEARQEAERALGMWRGTPLLDARDHRFAQAETSRLEGLRLSAEELRTTLLLREGETLQAVTSAERLIARDPLREASWAVLMRALYCAGRPAEALRRYEEVRALLARDLGLDPGPTLRETQLAVLRHDTAALRPPGRRAPATARDADPDLPGRAAELGRLSEVLRSAAAGRAGWAVVSGEPGAGKTRIAEEVARGAAETGWEVLWTRCAEESYPGARVPDRQLRRLRGQLERLTENAGGAAPRPTLYVVEDVHLASDDVRGLLLTCARTLRESPYAVLCTVADDAGPATERFLAELAGRGADLIPLAPLTESAVRLVASASASASAEAACRLRELSGGNPFLLDQLIRHSAHSVSGGRVPVPPAVRSMVRARLAALSPAARQVVDRAAVLGDRPDMRRVARLGRMPVGEVLVLADQAVAVRLLSWTEVASPYSGQGYRFPAGVLRLAVLGELSPVRRHTLRTDATRALARQ
ncbi:AAA family ATPase [Streptomyces sp. ISL-12]|uniref:BTAD domain-containing putative transcriptional regulator n=1 Tax=Streptomyces sp. ISL-12 TaxID=2819177 RepID=UPI001BEC64A6|nr:BTAD domain-containing putative transcriptional regulator [Streptomyces sp. ISL-12]MBT2414734.1 AAA family ATPase [Streptomyces sp. ISL-12]